MKNKITFRKGIRSEYFDVFTNMNNFTKYWLTNDIVFSYVDIHNELVKTKKYEK